MTHSTFFSSIKDKILSNPMGWVFSAHDLGDNGVDQGTIDVILHRLSKQGVIRRLGYGLYDIPRKSDFLGDLSPDSDEIINAYSKRMGQVFILDPLNAANALGLTTQVSSQLTYLTNGKSHILDICGMKITLIHASPKVISGAETVVGIVVQALRYFGAKGAPDHIINQIAQKLSPDDLLTLRRIKDKVMRNLVPQIDRIEQRAAIH